MDPIQHLVLYGSLRRGRPGHRRLGLHRRLRFVREVTVPGRLHDLGAYPALAPGAGRVHGELFEILDPALLPDLDAFEVFRPDDPGPYRPATGKGSLYRRETVEAAGVTAFIYVFNGPARGPVIASGRWSR